MCFRPQPPTLMNEAVPLLKRCAMRSWENQLIAMVLQEGNRHEPLQATRAANSERRGLPGRHHRPGAAGQEERGQVPPIARATHWTQAVLALEVCSGPGASGPAHREPDVLLFPGRALQCELLPPITEAVKGTRVPEHVSLLTAQHSGTESPSLSSTRFLSEANP